MTEPNNLEWQSELQNQIREFCEEYSIVEEGNGRDYMDKWFNRNYDRIELAITAKINEIENEAYIKGYVAGGVEILNASCEICHAYPMTADCNNANCHAIEI